MKDLEDDFSSPTHRGLYSKKKFAEDEDETSRSHYSNAPESQQKSARRNNKLKATDIMLGRSNRLRVGNTTPGPDNSTSNRMMQKRLNQDNLNDL